MINTLLIIDGLNLTRRMHAVLTDPQDMETLYQGISRACHKLINYHNPSHIILVWDGAEESWRKQLYCDYKKGRKPMPEALALGLPELKLRLENKDAIFSLDAPSEADDVIATLASKIINNNGQAIIVSTDKGFVQLTHTNIKQWDHFSQQYFDIAALENKLGIRREQFLDFVALAGDAGNKIPGITGIGTKTSANLLQKYQSIKNIYQAIDEIEDKYSNKLISGKAMAKLSYKLAKLVTDMNLETNLNKFRVPKDKN